MAEIEDIIIYTCIENGKEIKKSCVAYDDGTLQEGNYEDGIKAIRNVSKKLNITSKEKLREILNKNIVYTMTQEEYENYRIIHDNFHPKNRQVEFDPKKFDEAIKKYESIGKDKAFPVVEPYKPSETPIIDDDDEQIVYEDDVIIPDSYFDNIGQDDKKENDNSSNEEEQENIFNKAGEKLIEKIKIIKEKDKEHKGGIRGIIVCGVITGLLVGCCCTLTKCSKTGTMANSNLIQNDENSNNNLNNNQYRRGRNNKPKNENNDYNYNNNDNKDNSYTIKTNTLYADYKFTELLDVTKNDFQKTSMINLDATITGFNSNFANKYLESGHDIKAALTFDEIVALQQAYNSYTKDEIRAYFNGYEVDAKEMSNNYKSASLQLMGAYIIETSENPVDMIVLIDSSEGKEFYAKYHALYLKAKEATGEEQLKLVKEFYDNVKKDFPVTKEVRTEGIVHTEDHNSIKDYQLAVIPMIDAAERLFQNLEVDYTLGNSSEDLSTYDFMNSIGLCNYADDKFERIETITLSTNEDGENPTFIQYRRAIVSELIDKNAYVIDDEHRELSNLRRFQEILNKDPLYKHRNQNSVGNNSSSTNKTTTKTYTETTTTSKTETTTKNGGEIPEDKKIEVDKKIEEENKKAKEEAEKKAKEAAAKAQEEANKNKQTTENEVKKENEKTVTEIKNNNNDSSVKNITTDGSGANQPLPDPNEYGKDFDERVKVKTK